MDRFHSKFGQIVLKEQSANFLTKLHDGDVAVIPWSVIESPQFYSLFTKLGRRLMKRPTTHASAGEFLMTLKALMAELKVCLSSWFSL